MGRGDFTLSWCFAPRRAYDRERPDFSLCKFGKGERRFPQGYPDLW